jgi:two-component system sensor histidine kinase MtrB
MSLKRNLSIALFALGSVALTGAVSLMVLTSFMHRTVSTLGTGVQSVYLAQQAEIDLLAHARAADPVVKALLERDLVEKLTDLRRYVSTEGEAAVLSNAENAVDLYFGAGRDPNGASAPGSSHLDQALRSLRTLVDMNVRQTTQVQLEATRADRLGDRIGITVAILLIVGVAAVVVWLAGRAFQPVFAILNAMQRFAKGDRGARAPETGPDELRSIAMQFNAMAHSLARQRDNELAFLAGVAHDLRNPLSILSMSAVMSSQANLAADERRVNDLMSLVRRQVGYLDRMIGDLLDAARIEAGRLELRLQNEDLRALARSVYDLFRDSSPSHRLFLRLPDEPCMLTCDPLRVEQVLNNLVSNAIKYSPDGGSVRITVEPGLDREEAVISVSDEGIGIPSSQVETIFQPFQRSRSSKHDIPGIGLGLSVARRIVQAHAGRIHVESLPGQGSTFRVYLPIRPAATADKPGAATPAA